MKEIRRQDRRRYSKSADDERRSSAPQNHIRRNGAPLPVWSRSLACGNTIRELLPPIVSTFTRSEPRGIERLSAPEHHRYVRVLDCKVAHAREKSTAAALAIVCKRLIRGE